MTFLDLLPRPRTRTAARSAAAPRPDAETPGVPITECGERLVDLRRLTGVRLDRRRRDPGGEWARVRADVARRLVVVRESLPGGLELLVLEGLRAPARRSLGDPCLAGPDAHRCGSAIDVTLCTVTGVEVDLGGVTPERALDDAALRARAVLADAMGCAGFAGRADAWWHWSVGDRPWADLTGAPAARYAPLV